MTLPIDDALNRFKDNEERFQNFVNDPDGYTSSSGQPVESIPAFLERVEAEVSGSGAIATTEANKAASAASAASASSSAASALISSNNATSAKTAAEDARDIAVASATGLANGGIIGKATKALLDADLAYSADKIAIVTNDATPSNNGYYRKIGASGSGSWVASSYDRVAVVENRIEGIDKTYDYFISDGTTTEVYLRKPSEDSILKITDWQGVNELYSTARRNKLAKSNGFSDWTVAAGVSLTPNAAIAPDGTNTAWLVDWTSAAPSSGFYRYADDVAVIGQTDYIYVWMKSFSGTMTVNLIDAGSGSGGNITIGPEWAQYAIPAVHTVIQQGPWFRRDPGSEKFYVWGAEVKSAPSRYISTTTAARSITDYTVSNSNLINFGEAFIEGSLVRWVKIGDNPDAFEIGNIIADSDQKEILSDSDKFALSDSESNGFLKALSWSSLKTLMAAALSSVFIRLNQVGELSSDIFKISDAKTRVIIGPQVGSGGTGQNQTAIGYGAMVANTTGYDNVFIGTLSGRFNTSGSGNTCVGNQAGFATTTAYYLTAIGDACFRDSIGERNTGFGAYAGRNTTTGHDNVFIGWYAGSQQVTLDNALIIDNKHRASAAEEIANALIVGHFDDLLINQWLKINGKLKPGGDIEMQAGAKLKNIAQPTGTPAAATDLASAIALVNSLRSSLISLGLIA